LSDTQRHRVLVVDDEPDLLTLYELTLVREGYDVECAASLGEAWERLEAGSFQAVVTDMRLPDGTGMELLMRLDAAGRSERTVVITAFGSAENAVEALKAGAFDYLTKPVDLRHLRAVIASALGRLPPPAADVAPASAARGALTEQALAGGARALARLVGRSEAVQQVRSLIGKVARSMAPVLVQGESGTGKELVARAIHECSARASAPFVAVNCGAIPESLLEAEFFGYRKGAFSGAQEDRMGFFQAAQGGTLFLDEIGDLPLAMQSKLLRAVQERAARPVGAVAEVPVNVRLLSATHKDLAEEVQAGRFRQDLYYRLNVIRIHVPPLRERVADIGPICAALLERIAGEAGLQRVPELSAACLERLAAQPLPGNVRELENLLHRALALCDGSRIEVEDLRIDVPPGAGASPARGLSGAPGPQGAVQEGDDAHAGATQAARAAALPGDLAAHLDSVEREILERALQAHRYNRTAAGASLGLSLRQMRYRMARLGIGVDEEPESD
jgi:two-component system response regulator PilR (NtrC family)